MSEHEKKPTLREWVEQRHKALSASYPMMYDNTEQKHWTEEAVLEALDTALELHDAEVAALKRDLSEKRMLGVIQGWIKQGELSSALTRARAAFCACNQERRRLRDRETEFIGKTHVPVEQPIIPAVPKNCTCDRCTDAALRKEFDAERVRLCNYIADLKIERNGLRGGHQPIPTDRDDSPGTPPTGGDAVVGSK